MIRISGIHVPHLSAESLSLDALPFFSQPFPDPNLGLEMARILGRDLNPSRCRWPLTELRQEMGTWELTDPTKVFCNAGPALDKFLFASGSSAPSSPHS